jgi:hypothetical protein
MRSQGGRSRSAILLMSESGHFETKSLQIYWSHPSTGADVLGIGKPSAREARAPFHAAPVFISACSSNLRVARPATWIGGLHHQNLTPAALAQTTVFDGGGLAGLDAVTLKLPGLRAVLS